jgi:RND family efflux transporter MFP subunit
MYEANGGKMKNALRRSLAALAILIAGCQPVAQASPSEPVMVSLDPPVSQNVKEPQSIGEAVNASAEVVPDEDVQLSFPLVGVVRSVNVQVGDTVIAGQEVASIDTTLQEARVAEAEANLAAAEAQLAYQRRTRGTYQDHLDAAQAEIDRTRAIVAQTKATLAQANLYTPISGTVISVDISPGETVTPGQVILVVADLSQMHLETTDLSERDISAVAIGQSASVFIEALQASFEGQVIEIDYQSETIGGDVTYEVCIAFNDQPPGLRWGMSAEVKIHAEQ